MTRQITPTEANVQTTEAVYDILFGSQDLSDLDEYLATDIVQHVANEGDVHGISDVRAYFEEMYEVIPDISYELLESIADEERVAFRVLLTGTMRGDLALGEKIIEATNDPVSWEAFSSFRFEDGKVVESNVVVDDLTFLATIGAVPDMSQAAA